MADTPPTVRDPGPPLGSTADPVGYVPVSWMAVAAFVATAVFVIVLALSGFAAWRSKSPLIAPQLLFFPVLAVVLAFAARRVVRTSEGTRTGELFGIDLINTAWWGAVVVGLVYLTYMFAVDFAVRREAEAEVVRWVGYVTKDDLARAFHRTRDPAERASIAPDNAAALEARYRADWVAFTQSDLVRVAARNPGACSYVPGGLRESSVAAGKVECVAAGTLRCPEGEFPLQFPMKAIDVTTGETAGRQWQFLPPKNGFLRDEPRLTPYGWFVQGVERQGRDAAAGFFAAAQNRALRPFAAVEMAGLSADPAFRALTTDANAARLAAVGAPAGYVFTMPEDVYTATAARLFRLPGGKAPSPEQARTFAVAWSTSGVVPPGVRLRESPDVHPELAFSDTAVEVKVPVEVPLPSGKTDATARGRLVLVSTDAALVAEAKRLRAEANPDAGSLAPPPGSAVPRAAWTLVRIESDLRPFSLGGPPGPGGPGGPGGPPGF